VWLHSHFTARWIGRGGPRAPSNPDLTTSDFLSGIAQNRKPTDRNRGYLVKWTTNSRCFYCCSFGLFRKKSSRLQRCVLHDWAYVEISHEILVHGL
jgi:hypothetical protein